MAPAAKGSGSDKHAPGEVEGDFAEFLQAEQVKERLKREEEAEAKRRLKAAKDVKKGSKDNTSGGGGGVGGRGKVGTPEERWRQHNLYRQGQEEPTPDYTPNGPTLEERGYFPGDLMHHNHYVALSGHRDKAKRSTSSASFAAGGPTQHARHASSSGALPSASVFKQGKPRLSSTAAPPVFDENEDENAEMGPRPSTSYERTNSRGGGGSLGLSLDGRKSSETARIDDRGMATPQNGSRPVSRRTSHASIGSSDRSASSGDSYESSIAEPHEVPPINASVMSLKSFDSNNTNGAGSFASGGANRKLARPLLELEELELDSFLKNFGRHTREVRVPHTANFAQRRMPRWEDFKVPPGEAALAAAQGKRITVLTHVDRGLKALEEEEGELSANARPTSTPLDRHGHHDNTGSSKKKDKGDGGGKEGHHGFFHRSSKKDKKKDQGQSGGSPSDERVTETGSSNDGQSTVPLRPATSTSMPSMGTASISTTPSTHQQHVSWAPDPAPTGTKGPTHTSSHSHPNSPAKTATKALAALRSATSELGRQSPEMPFQNLRKHNIDLDEKTAKRREQDGMAGPHPQQMWASDQLNIHDEATEWRPSRDEAHLNEEEWELLHGPQSPEGQEEHEVEVQLGTAEYDQVDGIAWAIAYILATVERYAPEELDNTPDQAYRESRIRSHIERLYLIAPFWERLLYGIRRVYRWEDPRRTSTFAMIYFTLWYLDLIPTAFLAVLMFYVCQFRFFPPSASFLHEQVRARMTRGVDADRLAERLRRRSRLDVLELYKRYVVAYGSASQLAAGDVADFHEKVKNLILWRNPTATWRTLCLLGVGNAFVTFAPSRIIWKVNFAFLGFTFFILLPLQSHYPRFRRPLSPIWWALWGAPTDAQFAIQLLRRRHLERQIAKHPPTTAAEAVVKGTMGHGNQTSTDEPGGHDVQVAGIVGQGHSLGKAKTTSSDRSNGRLRDRFLKHSSAAQAVAYGALRPFRSGAFDVGESDGDGIETTGNLLDLQDVQVTEEGQILSRPRKLGSFFCQHHGVPGHLHVNTRMLYFVALHTHATSTGRGGRKTCKTTLEEITGMVKTKSIKLFVWNSSGLQITRRNKSSLFFSNMPHRDNAFNLLLAIGSEVWHKHV